MPNLKTLLSRLADQTPLREISIFVRHYRMLQSLEIDYTPRMHNQYLRYQRIVMGMTTPCSLQKAARDIAAHRPLHGLPEERRGLIEYPANVLAATQPFSRAGTIQKENEERYQQQVEAFIGTVFEQANARSALLLEEYVLGLQAVTGQHALALFFDTANAKENHNFAHLLTDEGRKRSFSVFDPQQKIYLTLEKKRALVI